MIHLLFTALLLDVLTTAYALSIGAREANPFLRPLVERFGTPILFVTHGALAVLLTDLWPSLTAVESAMALAFWWGVVLWNLVQIWRQRRAKGRP